MVKIGKEIERVIGARINFPQGTTRPSQEWISEQEICEKKAIQLRSAEETKSETDIKLLQLDPHAWLGDQGAFHCRFPNCTTIPRQKTPECKQAFFLCDIHGAKLTSEVVSRCAEENVYVNVKSFKSEDFNGYTSLIGQLEKAITYLRKKSSLVILRREIDRDLLLEEVCLNTRNFFLITNALLNPNADNVITVLSQFLKLFVKFLSDLDDPKLRENLRAALKDVILTTLYFFGVAYQWIVIDFFNPGGRIGAGIGLVLGFAGGVVFPPVSVVASTMVGLVAGGFIGSGAFSLYEQPHYSMRHQIAQEYQESMLLLLGRPVELCSDLIFALSSPSGDLTITKSAQN